MPLDYVCHPVVGGFKNPFGPIAVSRDGAAIGITSASNDVAVLDAATLRRRFPDVEIRPAFIIAMAISDDGSKVAVGCDDHGQRGGVRHPDPIFVVDMKSGVAASAARLPYPGQVRRGDRGGQPRRRRVHLAALADAASCGSAPT